MAGVVVEAKRHNNMSHIKSKDTMPEIMFCKALWHCGIRYRKNYKKLPGTPDIAITKRKIAIFVDGDFWHARNHHDKPGAQIKTTRGYWVPKLSRNVERDKEVNDALLAEGWLVLRFWESDIKKDVMKCVREIEKYL